MEYQGELRSSEAIHKNPKELSFTRETEEKQHCLGPLLALSAWHYQENQNGLNAQG